ncbi:MAG TPA: beta-propeller domain-containing protein, partial [Polyangiaceae bacterium]
MASLGWLRTTLLLTGLILFVGIQASCTTPGDFVSDNPAVGSGNPFPTGGGPLPPTGAGGAGGTGGAGGLGGAPGGGDPGRVIAEADIVQVAGDRLYALSRYGGLNVIDMTRPSDLQLLGRYRTQATPFEMYVRGSVVVGLFTSWATHVQLAGAWQWVQTSQVLVLDSANPASVRKLAEFQVPGEISDSRIVGNILYVVSYQNGSCYNCATGPRTTVTSLDVSNPSSVRKVDELAFDEVHDQWGWGRRSITVTTSRLYVAGRQYSSTGELGSEIQVVDIADPAGDLVLAGRVRVDGQITSRWQMDEYQGYLRVVSQPWQWVQGTVPTVQTFQIRSSAELVPAGRLALVLPRPEQLQSTRFDGTRAYAITAERTDPLFTIDLSDPAAPRQVGELEMPGFIYHMEPRGDRLIGLGFDQQNPLGALHVNLFDVSDLSAPRLIRRVNFGGSWASLPEDQDRIQKAFKVLDDTGLILVPFSGHTNVTSAGCWGTYTSGIQLVNFTRDSLSLAGLAPAYGEARRGLIHREALFAVSDERVQSFDITNRSAPRLLDSLAVARQVQAAVGVQDYVVRLGTDWWNNSTTSLDVTPLSQPDLAQGLGSLDFTSAVEGGCGSYMSSGRLFGHGSRAYVLYHDYDARTGARSSAAAIVDVANPASPKLEANRVLAALGPYDTEGASGSNNVVFSGDAVVQIGSTFISSRARIEYDPLLGTTRPGKQWLEIVDAATPSNIAVREFQLPFTAFTSGLHVHGTTVLTSHYESSLSDAGKVHFYLDRVDLSNPAAPRYLAKVNVPGSLLAWDGASGRAITVDYRRVVQTGVSAYDCLGRGGAGFTPDPLN